MSVRGPLVVALRPNEEHITGTDQCKMMAQEFSRQWTGILDSAVTICDCTALSCQLSYFFGPSKEYTKILMPHK